MTNRSGVSGRRASALAAAGLLGYAAVALLLTHPLVTSPASAVISQWEIDAEHSLWIQWWFATALESPELSLFESDRIRFPDRVDLNLADINLAVNLPLYFLARVTGPILAYNLMLWTAFILSAALLWQIARRISGDAVASWLAGLIFAASPYWISSTINSWLYLVHIWVLPLAFLAYWRAARGGGYADFAWAGLATAVAFHVSPYYFVFLGVLLVVLAPWFARDILSLAQTPGGAARLALAAAVALAAIAPRALPMAEAARRDWFVHTGPLNQVLAATPLELLVPNAPRPDRAAYGTSLVVFLSYTVPGVIAAGFWLSARRAAYRRWLVSAAAMFVLAFGPLAVWNTAEGAVSVPLPGFLLVQLPGFRFITNHWRWSLPGVFCLSIAFSIGLADTMRSARARLSVPRGALAAAVCLAYLGEVLFIFPFPFRKPLWTVTPDPISEALRRAESVEAILDLRDRPKLHQMTHEKRIVGGWLPRLESRSVQRTRRLLRELPQDQNRRVQYLGRLGIDAIVLADGSAYLIAPSDRTPGTFESSRLQTR